MHTIRLGVLLAAAALLVGCTPTEHAQSQRTPLDEPPDSPWAAVAQCLDEAGYPGFIADDSGLLAPAGSHGDDAQFALLLEAQALCAERAGFYSEPIPAEELPRLYALELEEIDCLRALGYESPTRPPSLQTYVDNTAQGLPWEAMREVFDSLAPTEQSEEIYTLFTTECPPPAASFTREQ